MIAFLLAAAFSGTADPSCSSVQTNDLIECAGSELRLADAQMNRQWRQALAKARTQERDHSAEDRAANGGLTFSQSLLASQRTWLAYRDAQCRLSTYRNWNGREYRIYRSGCLATLTTQRAKVLADFNEGQ